MRAEFEYTLFRLADGPPKTADRKWVDQLNEMAEKGWRLVTVTDRVAFFERPIQ
jgi:hypothetical protein